MKSKEDGASKKSSGFRRFAGVLVIFLNIVLLSSAFMLYMQYTSVYQKRLREENLGNIANLNQSASMNAVSLIGSWHIKLSDLAQYIELHNLSHQEALEMISDANSCTERYFELIGSDYTGFLAQKDEKGDFLPLDYGNSAYAPLQKIFDAASENTDGELLFTPEFTDGGKTAVKFFAIYKYLFLKDENGVQMPYTLLLAEEAHDVLVVLNGQDDFVGQSTVMIDAKGDYIVSNSDFKSVNFFQYLYVYNELTLDEKKAVQTEMAQNGSGELYYKNAFMEDCVFRYERMASNGWYCITSVPLSSFHDPVFTIDYVIYAIVILACLFAVDVSWLQGMNRKLRISMKREKEAGAAKGNFMSRMSHEIRTPLNAVIGYNTIACNEMAGAKTDAQRRQAEMKVLDCLTKSGIASRHLLTIINDVLDMSAIESGRIKVAHDRFDFKSLITSLTTIFYSQAKNKGVNFEVLFHTLTEEWFVGDQMRTNQILTNLLSNAVKFTAAGGSVQLTIMQPEADTNACHIHFEVADTGIGMTQEYLGHIWTPFEQADSSISRRFGGTGLGLSITKNLVDLMGGTIAVESELGVGTRFCVDLTFEKAEQPPKSENYDFSKVNALVVDDDVSTCDYIGLLFTRCGARCHAETSGAAALQAISDAYQRNDRYTVCLVDWRMPEMDGIETIRRIRSITQNEIPVIVLTAYDYTELADKAAEVGVDQFVSKPLFQSSLFDLLENISGKSLPERLEENEQYQFAGARLLLAEDNMMNMEVAKKILESAGLVVDSAWDGQKAVEMFTSQPTGTYRAILMDVHMPVMDGYQATKAIRTSAFPEAKTIPIIAMTADAFAENIAETLAAGMNDHVSKPIDVQILFATLNRYVSGKKAPPG